MSKFELPLQKKVSEDQQIQRNFNSKFPVTEQNHRKGPTL